METLTYPQLAVYPQADLQKQLEEKETELTSYLRILRVAIENEQKFPLDDDFRVVSYQFRRDWLEPKILQTERDLNVLKWTLSGKL